MQVSFLEMLLDVFSVDDQSGSAVDVDVVDEPVIEAVVGEPWTVAMGKDEAVDEPEIKAVVGEPWTVAMGTDVVVDKPVIEAVVEEPWTVATVDVAGGTTIVTPGTM